MVNFKKNYINWYSKNVKVSNIDGIKGAKNIELPFQCGDMIGLDIIPLKRGGYRITDDGWCLEDVASKYNIQKLNHQIDPISIYNFHLTRDMDIVCDVSRKNLFSALHGAVMVYSYLYNIFH